MHQKFSHFDLLLLCRYEIKRRNLSKDISKLITNRWRVERIESLTYNQLLELRKWLINFE